MLSIQTQAQAPKGACTPGWEGVVSVKRPKSTCWAELSRLSNMRAQASSSHVSTLVRSGWGSHHMQDRKCRRAAVSGCMAALLYASSPCLLAQWLEAAAEQLVR